MIDLSDRQLQALMNVLVFTPNAVYLAQGKRPPGWLIAASLAWLGISFLDDLNYLVRGEAALARDLEAMTLNRAAFTQPGHPPPPHPLTYNQALRYRVNRP